MSEAKTNPTQPDHSTELVKPPSATLTPRALVLSSLAEMWKFSQIVFNARTAPKAFPSAEDVFIAIEMGAELGMPPMMALANIGVINGKPAPYGDALAGICYASGAMAEFEEWFERDGVRTEELPDGPGAQWPENFAAVAMTRRKGVEKPKIQRYTIGQAKRAKLFDKAGPWHTATERMLKFRASGYLLRDSYPDYVKGFASYEEVSDYADNFSMSEPAPAANPGVNPPNLYDNTVYEQEGFTILGSLVKCDNSTLKAHAKHVSEVGDTHPQYAATKAEYQRRATAAKKQASEAEQPSQGAAEQAAEPTEQVEDGPVSSANESEKEPQDLKGAVRGVRDAATNKTPEEVAEAEEKFGGVEPQGPKNDAEAESEFMTDNQRRALFSFGNRVFGRGQACDVGLHDMAMKRYGHNSLTVLSKTEASVLIDELQARIQGGEIAPPNPAPKAAPKPKADKPKPEMKKSDPTAEYRKVLAAAGIDVANEADVLEVTQIMLVTMDYESVDDISKVEPKTLASLAFYVTDKILDPSSLLEAARGA